MLTVCCLSNKKTIVIFTSVYYTYCMCELEIPPETPGPAIVNGNPGAIKFQCFAQGHINRCFTLSARGFELAIFQLLAQNSNH